MGRYARNFALYLTAFYASAVLVNYLQHGVVYDLPRLCYAPPKEPKTYTTKASRSPASTSPRAHLVEVDRNDTTVVELLHLDDHGLIVQSDGDGGDTAQRTGMFYFIHRNGADFEKALSQLEIRRGVYVRHPYQMGFRSDPNRFSRDQQRPLVIALGANDMKERLWDLFLAHAQRFGKYQNLDFIGPVNVGEYIRAFKSAPLYPVLLLTDAALLLGSLDLAVKSHFDLNEVDDNNHLLTLLQAQETMPTPLSYLARKAYKHLRAANFGNTIYGESDAVQGAFAWYHRKTSGGNTMIAEGYRRSIDNL